MVLPYCSTGDGAPLLLIYGAGEDADLLQPQADAFAARGYRVITYDRRGTGRAPRKGWPEAGVAQHVADAADLLAEVAGEPATVLGLSSGAIVALALAAEHPDLVERVIAWEAPALAVLPDGPAMHGQMVAPLQEHLQSHPGDWSGAYDVVLMIMSGGAADLEAPIVQRMRRNAEAAVRDDAQVITAHRLVPRPDPRVVIATGESPDPLLGQIAAALAEGYGTTPHTVAGAQDHEVYLSEPEVLAAAFARDPARSPA
jgi:pimeloyl-ACP methyl ester carboxylesterase